MKILYNHLRLAAVCYMAAPIVIFFIGWLGVLPAIIFSVLLTAGVVFMIKNSAPSDGKKSHIYIPKKTVVIIAVISLVWCFLAGQGGFIHQSLDNLWRNAIFHDLIKKPWPVIYEGDRLLCYYIAHWMLPALIGKAVYLISGSVFGGYLSGNIALLIYTAFGCFLTLLLVAVMTVKKRNSHFIAAAVLFIFFSGLDAAGKAFTVSNLGNQLEWWGSYFQFSSISTCLFWVYNQTVAPWLATLCILNERSAKNFALLGMLALPFAPFPFIGIVAICIIRAFFMGKREIGRKKTLRFIRNTVSVQNILSCLGAGIPFALYYSANSIVSEDAYYNGVKRETGFRLHDELMGAIATGSGERGIKFIGLYLFFIAVEAGIYLLLIAIANKKRKKLSGEFIAYSIALAALPLFQVGMDYDFSMRVSIPFIVYIAVEFIRLFTEEIPPKGSIKSIWELLRKKPLFTAAALAFLVGVQTPAAEFIREIRVTFMIGPRSYFEFESLEDFEEINNFAAYEYEEGYFYKLIMKRRD